jgi:hypothetical protein
MTLKKLATTCIRLAGVVVLLICEDSLLWITPVLTQEAFSSSRAKVFRSRCEEIKVGMGRGEVLTTIHRGTRIWREFDRPAGRNGEGRELRFEGDSSVCTVSVDPTSGRALGVSLELPGAVKFE